MKADGLGICSRAMVSSRIIIIRLFLFYICYLLTISPRLNSHFILCFSIYLVIKILGNQINKCIYLPLCKMLYYIFKYMYNEIKKSCVLSFKQQTSMIGAL